MLETLAHSTDIWVLFSFIIFGFIILKAVKGSVIPSLDNKIEAIKSELASAESLHVEAQELLAQYQRKHTNAVNEANDIIENAEKYAAKIRKQAKKELKENLDRRETQLAERIDRMKETAILEIQRHAADIAIDTTREIIQKEFDQKADKAFTDSAIKDIRTHIN